MAAAVAQIDVSQIVGKRGLLASVGVAAGVAALRFSGLFQGLELLAYDGIMRSRPADSIDRNILVVGITEAELDVNGFSSISDATLEKLLDRLYQSGASVVGLDLVRDSPIDPDYSQLIDYFADSDKLITACGTSASGGDGSELEPSPQANPDGVGLAESSRDKDLTARRHLLAMDSSVGQCKAEFAFSTLLAYQYLLSRSPEVEETAATAQFWTWGDLQIPLLRSHQGAYHNEDMRGDTTLLNYRMTKNVDRQPFEIVTLSEILSDAVSDEVIEGRVVLIGTTAKSMGDSVKTPFRTATGAQAEIPGVVFQAHQISQLVDAVLGQRRLLRSLPRWADGVWILLWAGIGGLIVGRSLRLRYLLAVSVGATGMLYIICWAGFVWMGLWLPWVPAAISLASTVSLLAATIRSDAST